MMDRIAMADQLRRALQLFASGLTEEEALEVAAVYDPWKAGKPYAAGEFLTYGENTVSDPQLYKTIQAHTAQAHWLPDKTPALYAPVGLNPQGIPLWSRPAGAHDAYSIGDIVDYQGALYESQINGNDTVPGTDERWWKAV